MMIFLLKFIALLKAMNSPSVALRYSSVFAYEEKKYTDAAAFKRAAVACDANARLRITAQFARGNYSMLLLRDGGTCRRR